MENKCSMSARNSSCPTGYCCAYDEFFRIIHYCKKLGAVGATCSTVKSDADCPCEPGLTCVPRVQGSTFVTIYGRCQARSVTTESTNTDNAQTSDRSGGGTDQGHVTHHGHVTHPGHVTRHGWFVIFLKSKIWNKDVSSKNEFNFSLLIAFLILKLLVG
jgi:hypothetical protein